ncbi:MAG: gliding motility-associated ABC transporter substrate-binding protein GldG [Bacteroidales bacterium]|nr:gliding motility-associated ABC transporter substrate-binding protein GldG [Bacteroidales bacterium]
MKIRKRNTVKRNNLIQLLLGLIIIILINIISSFVFTRFDLTSEKRYSLSDATKELLKEMDDIVYFKVYLEGEFPAGFKRLRRETKEMLDEFRAYSNNIQYEFIDPSASEDINTRNSIYEQLISKGLNPTDLQVKNKAGMSQQIIFPGAVVSYTGKEMPLSLLTSQIGVPPEAVLNNSIQDLEFNISNVIMKLTANTKAKVAFIEGHGELSEIEVYDITQSLKEYYKIERISIDGQINSLSKREILDSGKVKIINKYDAIIIAKPDSAFSDQDKFIIDQYIMYGGRVLWLIDPVFASMDSLQKYSETVGITNDLRLDDLLFKYGVRLNNNLIMDINSLPIPLLVGHIGDQPQFEFFRWYYFPVITPLHGHPIVNNLNAIRTEFISSIDTVILKNIKKTVLLSCSPYCRTINTPAMISLQILKEEPDKRLYQGPERAVAVLLEGEFESMFTYIIPPEVAKDQAIGFLKKSLPNKMIIISDGDVIRNQLHLSKGYPLPLGFDQYTRETFGNKELIMNAMNYLCDDSGLISIRSRELKLRLLDKTKIANNNLKWQLLNLILPIVLVIAFGFIHARIRKQRYTG